jgi:clathrin heavy chain
MENYSNINDIRRVMLHARQIPEEFLIGFFGQLTPDNAIKCLYDMLRTDRDNL